MKPLRASGKEVLVDTPRANEAIIEGYERAIRRILQSLYKSLLRDLVGNYDRLRPLSGMATDARYTSFEGFRKRMAKTLDVLRRTVDSWADIEAASAIQAASKSNADAWGTNLSRAGFRNIRDFTIKLKPTAQQTQAIAVAIAENSRLIKSIAARFLDDVEGTILRGYMEERNGSAIAREICDKYDVSKKRANLIARDQIHKANAAFNRSRQQQLGIEEAVWQHSSAGKEPRPEHVKWGKEKARYKIADGMWSEVDSAFVWPGTPINCRCTGRSIIPGIDDSATD